MRVYAAHAWRDVSERRIVFNLLLSLIFPNAFDGTDFPVDFLIVIDNPELIFHFVAIFMHIQEHTAVAPGLVPC